MKLEGELSFFHSKIGREPESQSFEFNDNDLDSAGYKLQNQKVKEYENTVTIDSKRNEQDLDLSHEMESADHMTAPKLDFSNSVIDLKHDYEAQGRDFVEPVSHSSKEKRSFMKFPNDIGSVKRSPTSPMSDPPEQIDSFESSVDVYMDKSVTECEPELIVCFKESNYHVVKDICVDEGVPTLAKVLFENAVNEKDNNFSPSKSYENKEMKKDNHRINVLNVPAAEESDQVSASHDQSKDSMHKDEDVTEQPLGNVNKEMDLPEDKVLLQELDAEESRPSNDKGEQVSGEPESNTHTEQSTNIIEEAVLASPALALEVDDSNNDSILLENKSFTYQFDPSIPAACGKDECHLVGGCEHDETQNISMPIDWKSDDQAVTSQDRHGLGESSFSAVGPVSGRISYSGPVPYSGSISLRSDSSTTSTRSFAFPVLQSEWNSSPVKMAKADRRNYRKHRGWRQGFLCCRF